MNWTDLKKELKKRKVRYFSFGVEGQKGELLKELKVNLREELKREGLKLSQNPQVQIVLKEKNSFSFTFTPLLIYGRYNKYCPMPQTKWPCRFCKGKGCEKCNFTGKQYPEAVEWVFQKYVERQIKGKFYKFHASGREDIDAYCLGKRPFVFEVRSPSSCELDLRRLEEEIRKDGRIEVFDLRYSTRKEVREIKNQPTFKAYVALIKGERKLDPSFLKNLEGTVVQRTPLRVLHRRSDRARERRIYKVELLGEENRLSEVLFITDPGTYIKEIVSGDEGRTKPSLSEITRVSYEVEKLYIVGVEKSLEFLLTLELERRYREGKLRCS